MQLQRQRDTAPEMAIRRELHRRGLRYRVDLAAIPATRRRIDIAFTRCRVAVFIDGCFWHGCPDHGQRRHEINGWYWPGKIAGNKERDADTDRRLGEAGWAVRRFWEHDDPLSAADQIAALVRVSQRTGDS